jgi:hypothetical protein
VKRKRYPIVIALLLGLSAAASAAAIRTAGSSYGSPPTLGSCTDCASLPAGVTVMEQAFAFSQETGKVFAFEVTSDTSNFTLTLSGTTPFLTDFMNSGTTYFGFGVICGTGTGIGSSGNPCSTLDPNSSPFNATVSALSNGTDNGNTVTFTFPGDGQGFAFYAIESEPAGAAGTVTATITLNGSAVPEPASWPILGLAIAGLVFLHQRRSAKFS